MSMTATYERLAIHDLDDSSHQSHSILLKDDYSPRSISSDGSQSNTLSISQSISSSSNLSATNNSSSSNFDYDRNEQRLILTTDETLGRSIATIRHDASVPITRPPTKPRDVSFGIAFLLHFLFVIIIFIVEDKALSSSYELYYRKDLRVGSWSSVLMMVTLIGSLVGAILCLIITNPDTRRQLFFYGILFSVIFQICLGNILLLIHSSYSVLGLLFLFSAFIDSYRYKSAMKSMNFTCALVQMSLDIGKLYGISLFLACSCIVIFQTCLLLWWGAFIVGILSQVTIGYAVTIYMIFLMLFSYYWITQFFHGFMSFMIGGCILWYFLREEEQELNPSNRVLLLLQCGFITSFGSISKGALFSPIAQIIIGLNNWSNHNQRGEVPSIFCSGKNFIKCIVHPFANQSIRYNRLAYSLIATYGRTYCRAAEDHILHYPYSLRISSDDNAHYTLTAVATALAGLISIIFGLISDRNEGTSWPLFLLVNFLLTYSGISLVIQSYRSAVDALIVAFAETPDRFAEENQIVFLRFLRYTESGLQ